jgi:hypothetical protein
VNDGFARYKQAKGFNAKFDKNEFYGNGKQPKKSGKFNMTNQLE